MLNLKKILLMVEGGGFEPPKLSWQIYNLLPLATREPLHSSATYNIHRALLCKQFFKIYLAISLILLSCALQETGYRKCLPV